MICFCEYTNQLTFDKERNFSSNRRCYYTIIGVMSFSDHLWKSRVNFFDILFPCCLLLTWGVKLPSWTCMLKLFPFFFVYLICFRKFQITYLLSFGLKTLKSKYAIWPTFQNPLTHIWSPTSFSFAICCWSILLLAVARVTLLERLCRLLSAMMQACFFMWWLRLSDKKILSSLTDHVGEFQTTFTVWNLSQ